jgi:hypothetical protein
MLTIRPSHASGPARPLPETPRPNTGNAHGARPAQHGLRQASATGDLGGRTEIRKASNAAPENVPAQLVASCAANGYAERPNGGEAGSRAESAARDRDKSGENREKRENGGQTFSPIRNAKPRKPVAKTAPLDRNPGCSTEIRKASKSGNQYVPVEKRPRKRGKNPKTARRASLPDPGAKKRKPVTKMAPFHRNPSCSTEIRKASKSSGQNVPAEKTPRKTREKPQNGAPRLPAQPGCEKMKNGGQNAPCRR